MKYLNCLVLSAALSAAPLSGMAQEPAWPTKPIHIVVPYPAGGAVDVMVRAVSAKMSQILGQPVIVDAKPGGNSNIGAETVQNAPADGYTLLATSPWFILNQLIENGRRWKHTDFKPVAHFAFSPNYLVVGSSSPARSVADYVAIAKQSPGLLYGSTGIGSTQDMAVKMFGMTAGIQLDPVLYKGAPPIIPDLVAGRLTMAIVAGGNATAQVRAGRLRALASTGANRSATTPDVPTMAESGYPDVTVVSWYGFHAPAGTPDAVVKTLADAVKAAAADPKVVESIATANGEVAYQNAAEFDRYVAEELARWTKVVASIGKQ